MSINKRIKIISVLATLIMLNIYIIPVPEEWLKRKY
jgi:hypothetical protein